MELENKPKNTDLAQQRLEAWKFNISAKGKAILYLIIGILLIFAGVMIVFASSNVIEHKKRYDDRSGCKSKNDLCEVKFDVDDHMKGDVFLYYEIHNLYQNHRQYSRGLSVGQMLGHNMKKVEIERVCEPIIKIEDLKDALKEEFNINTNNSKHFNKNDVANPCGVIANSFFYDKFQLSSTTEKIKIKENDIAFQRDKDDKFKRPDSIKDKTWIDVTDEHFIVWTSIASTPNFRKLWGRIDGLDKGKYTMMINSSYDVSDFNGKKFFVLTSKSLLGGKNIAIGLIYLVIGSVSFASSFVFWYEFYCERKSFV